MDKIFESLERMTPGIRLRFHGIDEETLKLLVETNDGIVSLGDGDFLFSSFFDSTIFWLGSDTSVRTLVEGMETPADIGFDRGRDRLLIPHFQGDAVTFLDLVRSSDEG